MLLCVLLTLMLAGGCSDETIPTEPDEPDPETEEGSMFARYVALGSDLTAGVQSDGINQETQGQTYAALVAEAIGAEFTVPQLALPGCPAPLTNAFTGERLGEGAEDACAGLAGRAPTILNNVAVPGARIYDLLSEPAEENPMNTLMLGGRTQLEAMAEADPTFVSVWFGIEELLEHLRGRRTTVGWRDLTAAYSTLLDSLEARGVRGGVVIGLPFLHYELPYWSSGLQYVEAKAQGLLPETFTVAESCTSAWRGGWQVPYSHGIADLLKRAQAGEEVVLDCENDGPVLSPTYWEIEVNSQPAYNELIRDAVEAKGWAYVDYIAPEDHPNYPAPFTDSSECNVPRFPNLPGSSEPPFGACFSLDGFRPSALGHRILAQDVLDAINETYGTRFTLK